MLKVICLLDDGNISLIVYLDVINRLEISDLQEVWYEIYKDAWLW